MYSRNKAPFFVIPGSVLSPLYRPHFRLRCQGLTSLNSGSGRQGLTSFNSGSVRQSRFRFVRGLFTVPALFTVCGGFRGKGFRGVCLRLFTQYQSSGDGRNPRRSYSLSLPLMPCIILPSLNTRIFETLFSLVHSNSGLLFSLRECLTCQPPLLP